MAQIDWAARAVEREKENKIWAEHMREFARLNRIDPDGLSRSERSEVISCIASRTGCTRRQASRRQLWIHPWVNGQRNIAVGRDLPLKVGGGFSVDFEITLYR